jgi:hypothetical protein
LLGDFDLRKERTLVERFDVPRFFVLARLLQVGAFAGAIQRDFALFAAALWADAPVHSRAEALFLSSFADGAGQRDLLF